LKDDTLVESRDLKADQTDTLTLVGLAVIAVKGHPAPDRRLPAYLIAMLVAIDQCLVRPRGAGRGRVIQRPLPSGFQRRRG
jgi:hypothetical protein